MRSEDVDIGNPTGLHARPAAVFIKTAREFQSSVTVVKGDRRANGKSLLALLKTGISRGDRIRIEVEGVDEDAAVAVLAALVRGFAE